MQASRSLRKNAESPQTAMHVLCVGSRRVRSLEGRRSFIAFRAIPRNMPSDAPGAGPSVQAPSRRRPYTGAGERNSSMESAKHPAKLRKQMAGEDEPADHQAESRLKDPDRCILPSENCMVPVRIENVMQEEQKKHDGPCPLMGSIPPERIAIKNRRASVIRISVKLLTAAFSFTASPPLITSCGDSHGPSCRPDISSGRLPAQLP